MAVRKSRAVSAGLLANAISSSRCRDSPNFGDGVIISQLVAYAACFLALLSVAICWLRISKKKPGIRATLSWYNYCVALLLTMTFYILEILVLCLANCSVINGEITLVTSEITLQLAGLILLAVMLLPFTLCLLRRAGQNTRFVKTANTCVLAVVGLLLPPYLILGSLFSLSPWIDQSLHLDLRVILGLSTAYRVLYLFASAFGAALLVFALLKAVGDIALSSVVKRWTLFTLSSFVLSNLVLVIDIFGWILPQRNLPKTGSLIIITLSNAFLTATFAGMLMTVSNCELPPHDPTDHAMSDPDDVDIQPRAKKRFTHTGTTEIDQSSPRYSRYSGAEDCKILKQSQIYQTSVGGCREV